MTSPSSCHPGVLWIGLGKVVTMWAGIIVIGVAIGLFLVARVVVGGGVGRLRFGDRPTDPGGDPTGRPSGGGDGPPGF